MDSLVAHLLFKANQLISDHPSCSYLNKTTIAEISTQCLPPKQSLLTKFRWQANTPEDHHTQKESEAIFWIIQFRSTTTKSIHQPTNKILEIRICCQLCCKKLNPTISCYKPCSVMMASKKYHLNLHTGETVAEVVCKTIILQLFQD